MFEASLWQYFFLKPSFGHLFLVFCWACLQEFHGIKVWLFQIIFYKNTVELPL